MAKAAQTKFHWKIEYAIYVVFEAILSVLPGTCVAHLGRQLGRVAHRFAQNRRRTVRRNLRIAFAGEKTLAEIDRMTREVFCRSGANLLSALHTARIAPDRLDEIIEVEGMENMQAAHAGGRGSVIVLAHMGNWEAIAQMFPRLAQGRFRTGTVYRPLNNAFIDARVAKARHRSGLALFSKRDTPLAMTAFIKSGGMLGILSDQRAGGGGELVPFFGRLTNCSPLPSLFARRAKSAVIGLSMKTIGAGRWRLKIHALQTDSPDTATCMQFLERLMRESPEDVFWMQDRWRLNRRQPLSLTGKMSAAASGASKPRRVLVIGDIPDGQLPAVPAGSVRWERVAIGAQPDSVGALSRRLRELDESAVLPVECILCDRASPTLAKACRRAGFILMDATGQTV